MDCHVCGHEVDMTQTYENGTVSGEDWVVLMAKDWPSDPHGMVFHRPCYERFTELQAELAEA